MEKLILPLVMFAHASLARNQRKNHSYLHFFEQFCHENNLDLPFFRR